MIYQFILSGMATGFLVGLTGVGGGALMTPLLLLVFGIPPLSAVGTDLWFAAVTKCFAARVHHGHELIDWNIVKRLWMGSLPTTGLALIWIHFNPLDSHSLIYLKTAIAIAVLMTAAGIFFQKKLHALGQRLRTTKHATFKAAQLPLTIFSGALLGGLVTFTSVGAGALGAVFLAYLYPFRLTTARLIATDIAHAIPLAIFAGIGHLIIGNVDFELLGYLTIGSIPGVLIGSTLSARLDHELLRYILATVLVLIGLKLFV